MPVTPPCNRQPLIRNDQRMRYRKLGRTGWEVSALSFGCMRLCDDQEYNTKLVQQAIDAGVNYFETTRYYLNGTCQHRTAPGLGDRRDSLIVSGKDGINPNKTAYQFRKEIENQLTILGLSHFKFYQVGWFSWEMFPHLIKPGSVWDAIRQARAEGLIQCVGFTGHDTPENFIRCIETGLFDSITVPYNLVNRSYEPAIARAAELGVGVVAMCPVAGGVLSCESDRLKDALGMDLPTTEMALRFVLSNPGVSTACSGMNAIEQLEQNVKSVRSFDPAQGVFEQMCAGLDRLRAGLGDRFCTACRYCMPCPQGVDIPQYMGLYRDWKAFGLTESVTARVRGIGADKSAARCTQCGACEKTCPNRLQVCELLRAVEALR
ncbi:MAG: aldo/keto reductase [bacterium]